MRAQLKKQCNAVHLRINLAGVQIFSRAAAAAAADRKIKAPPSIVYNRADKNVGSKENNAPLSYLRLVIK